MKIRTLKNLLMAIIGITLIAAAVYAKSGKGKGNEQSKHKAKNLFTALEKPKMRDPYGHDKESGREKSARGRAVRKVEPEESVLDLASIVGIEFNTKDYHLDSLNSIYAEYQSELEQLDPDSASSALYARGLTIYESTINNYASSNIVRVRVNQADKIDYSMTLTPPDGFEGTKLLITTTLTNINDYDTSYNTYNYVYDSETGTWQREPVTTKRNYEANQVIMEQTQEVVIGDDNNFSFSYDPPFDLAGYSGLDANLSVTVTEPESGQSYTATYDKTLYLYR
ncbi:MAG: hypothetical protein HQ552_12340 [Desulfobacteraceae bacterium]|nr:hypothetical protein [Desulfobacteraceae bacterium]